MSAWCGCVCEIRGKLVVLMSATSTSSPNIAHTSAVLHNQTSNVCYTKEGFSSINPPTHPPSNWACFFFLYLPLPSFKLISAPALSNNRTISAWPPITAMLRGRLWYSLLDCICSRSSGRLDASAGSTGECVFLAFHKIWLFTSMPDWINCRAFSMSLFATTTKKSMRREEEIEREKKKRRRLKRKASWGRRKIKKGKRVVCMCVCVRVSI